MTYVKTNDNMEIVKYPYSVYDLRVENQNVCFPKNISETMLAEYNVYLVTEEEEPIVKDSEIAKLNDIPEFIDGSWVLTWTVSELEQNLLVKEYTKEVQLYLDETAQSQQYDNILSLCSYANSTNAKFAAEAKAGIEFRDNVWVAAETILNDITSGNRTIPSKEELLLELPRIDWPEDPNFPNETYRPELSNV